MTTTNVEEMNTMEAQPSKRKPGRPRKHSKPASDGLDKLQEVDSSEQKAEFKFQAASESDAQIVTVHIDSAPVVEESSQADDSNAVAVDGSEVRFSSQEAMNFMQVVTENQELQKADATTNEVGTASGESTSTTVGTHTIHLVDGEKGGAGKSFVSRAFIEYCQHQNLNFAIVDADTSNKDISKIYSECVEAFFSDDEKQAREADKIFDLAFEKSVLVNLPAQVYDKVTNWIERNDLIELGQENSIRFVKWFVCTGGHDSVEFFLKSVQHFGNRMTHVFVRNMGLCDDWSYVEGMEEYQDALAKYNFIVMDFPKFSYWERNMVDRMQLTFTAAIDSPEFKVVSKQRVKKFLFDAEQAFAETGLVR